jgi:hypothetical protein
MQTIIFRFVLPKTKRKRPDSSSPGSSVINWAETEIEEHGICSQDEVIR